MTGYDALHWLVEAHRQDLIREADNERLLLRLRRSEHGRWHRGWLALARKPFRLRCVRAILSFG